MNLLSMYNKLFSKYKTMKINQDEWFNLVADSYSNPSMTINGNPLPKFPSDQIQINTTGQAGIASLKEAFIFYQDCIQTFQELDSPIDKHDYLLDFGVGWGRISRFFLRELSLENIYGLDVMEEFVQICRDTFGNNNFHITSPYPPTKMPDEKFKFIVGFSVFSHLSEKACSKWMSEFNRILEPGGIVAVTTRGRPFFDYCESLKEGDHTGYTNALSKAFDNFDDARARYDKGNFVHSNIHGVTGGGILTAEFYGESFIPESYAKNAYKNQFKMEKFLFDPSRQSHPILFFRKHTS